MVTPELNKALSKAQGEILPPAKETENPFYKSKYADLNSIVEAIKKPLQNNGLSVTQTTRFENGMIILITTLRHESGEEVSGEYPVIPLKQDPQAYGSALTYARRYTLQSIMLVAAEEDDDGNSSSSVKPQQNKKQNSQPSASPKKVVPTDPVDVVDSDVKKAMPDALEIRVSRMLDYMDSAGIYEESVLEYLGKNHCSMIDESDLDNLVTLIKECTKLAAAAGEPVNVVLQRNFKKPEITINNNEGK